MRTQDLKPRAVVLRFPTGVLDVGWGATTAEAASYALRARAMPWCVRPERLEMAEARDAAYPYVWFWRQKPRWDGGSPPRVFDRDRKGERCRVVARGRMNSALLEFVDGYRVVTSRGGLRRA